jgi:NADH dehydrogenase
MESLKKVLIVGGGFAGIEAARSLGQMNMKGVSVTLLSNKSYFEYYPALYRVVTGASPIEVCVPLTDMVPKNVQIVLDGAVAIDLTDKSVTGMSGAIYTFDYIVLALGSETTYFNLPGLADLAFGFKSVKEAVNLKKHLHLLFESHTHPDNAELVSHFHIIIVGGGPSGVEVAGDLTTYMRKLATHYSVDPSLVTIDLIESNNRLVPAVSEKASARILARLRTLGVNVFLNRQLVSEEVEQVYLKDMNMKAKTVIWTAGTKLNALFEKIQGLSFSPKKRVLVDEYMRAVGFDYVFVAGDAAGTQFSGLAQTAIYDGQYIADALRRIFRKKDLKQYTPKPTAFSIPVGEGWGVFAWKGFRMYGRVAYWLRHAIDFMYFAGILSPRKLISLFFEGWRYRSVVPLE